MTAIVQRVSYPEHIIVIDGRIINADVSAQHIDELQWYAETEKVDLEGECFSRYGYGSDWLTVKQLGEMFRVIAEGRTSIINSTPSHFHRCPECGASQMYFDKNCNHQAGDVTEECRHCEEGHYLKSRRPAL
jgi:hypothetical protein